MNPETTKIVMDGLVALAEIAAGTCLLIFLWKKPW